MRIKPQVTMRKCLSKDELYLFSLFLHFQLLFDQRNQVQAKKTVNYKLFNFTILYTVLKHVLYFQCIEYTFL